MLGVALAERRRRCIYVCVETTDKETETGGDTGV